MANGVTRKKTEAEVLLAEYGLNEGRNANVLEMGRKNLNNQDATPVQVSEYLASNSRFKREDGGVDRSKINAAAVEYAKTAKSEQQQRHGGAVEVTLI
ncbi:MAG: hypothetical protein WC759_04440, partial [Candidatus Micrarchaeia archaeon]